MFFSSTITFIVKSKIRIQQLENKKRVIKKPLCIRSEDVSETPSSAQNEGDQRRSEFTLTANVYFLRRVYGNQQQQQYCMFVSLPFTVLNQNTADMCQNVFVVSISSHAPYPRWAVEYRERGGRSGLISKLPTPPPPT